MTGDSIVTSDGYQLWGLPKDDKSPNNYVLSVDNKALTIGFARVTPTESGYFLWSDENVVAEVVESEIPEEIYEHLKDIHLDTFLSEI